MAIAEKIMYLNRAGEDRLTLQNDAIVWAGKHTWLHSGVAFYDLCLELSTR